MRVTSENRVYIVITAIFSFILPLVLIFKILPWRFFDGLIAFVCIHIGVFTWIMVACVDDVLKSLYGYRNVLTKHEKEYLEPLLEEMLEDYQKSVPHVRKLPQLYMSDSILINAYAIGVNTIVLNRGIIGNLSDDEIKGIMAHELGHLHNGDTIVPLVAIGLNPFSFYGLVVTSLVKSISRRTSGDIENQKNYNNFLLSLVRGFYLLFSFIGQCFVMAKSREAEYQADEFAYNLGYGEDLLKALYSISDIASAKRDLTIAERVQSTHPNLFVRIAHLENLLDGVSEQEDV